MIDPPVSHAHRIRHAEPSLGSPSWQLDSCVFCSNQSADSIEPFPIAGQPIGHYGAFAAPYDLVRRLGHEPDAAELAGYDPEALTAVFAERPAPHRFPKAMAARVQELCRVLVERYDGDPAKIWTEAPDGRTAFKRINELPGFGKQKSQIFLALLGKRFDVRPTGWQEAAGQYGDADAHYSVADITDPESLLKVRVHKQRMKAASKA
ncbi:HhH-GPD-type base excision DNA repair protein [Micromonospora sp. NPDC050417]|uniref:HhH-GPD-type base excision DNA repair protein n=1 Tax=Micromonospora sp. NPDC050417 TaxID=3364280 RepID=UPI0037927054